MKKSNLFSFKKIALLMLLVLSIAAFGCLDSSDKKTLPSSSPSPLPENKLVSSPSPKASVKPVSLSGENAPKKFSSLQELLSLLSITSTQTTYRNDFLPSLGIGSVVKAVSSTSPERATDYSVTNVQVEGVDEADIVKNDGKYIYLVEKQNTFYPIYRYYPYGASSSSSVLIIDAFPASKAKVVSEIKVNGSVSEIFVYGDKLVVFGNQYSYPDIRVSCTGCIMPRRQSNYYSFMYVYDVSNKEKPVLVKKIDLIGAHYKTSRMVEGRVYGVFDKYEVSVEDPLPSYSVDGVLKQIPANEVNYFNDFDSGFRYVLLIGIDLNELSKEESRKALLSEYGATVFASKDNIYLAYDGKRDGDYCSVWPVYKEVYWNFLPASVQEEISSIESLNLLSLLKEKFMITKANEYFMNPFDLTYSQKIVLYEKLENAFKEYEKKIQSVYQQCREKKNFQVKTVVNKFSLDNQFTYLGSAEVPGRLLNQFSMDEHENYFRIATTLLESQSGNNVYVIDSSMKVVGRLEGLAPGESIQSTRFMGNKLYMVTYRTIDPFYVIDLSNPIEPKVLGYLKIPGYSTYLHAYDENHVIGLGVSTKFNAEGSEVREGIKLSLYDVTNVSNPIELFKQEIGVSGTYSYALSDHKAFLFSKSKNILVIPVTETRVGKPNCYYNGEKQVCYPTYEHSFQGAYVFGVSPEKGFNVKARISHSTGSNEENIWWNGFEVTRSLYMEDVLYTISNKLIKAHDLNTFSEINSVKIGVQPPNLPSN